MREATAAGRGRGAQVGGPGYIPGPGRGEQRIPGQDLTQDGSHHPGMALHSGNTKQTWQQIVFQLFCSKALYKLLKAGSHRAEPGLAHRVQGFAQPDRLRRRRRHHRGRRLLRGRLQPVRRCAGQQGTEMHFTKLYIVVSLLSSGLVCQ